MTVCLAFQIEVIRAINQLLKFFFSLLQQSALLSGLENYDQVFLLPITAVKRPDAYKLRIISRYHQGACNQKGMWY
ncbi:MAG TPA: hypothetical protein DF774_01055 [Rheinheimera sp.]|nr:hypothetical protein [Rheinheimera sp.]